MHANSVMENVINSANTKSKLGNVVSGASQVLYSVDRNLLSILWNVIAGASARYVLGNVTGTRNKMSSSMLGDVYSDSSAESLLGKVISNARAGRGQSSSSSIMSGLKRTIEGQSESVL